MANSEEPTYGCNTQDVYRIIQQKFQSAENLSKDDAS